MELGIIFLEVAGNFAAGNGHLAHVVFVDFVDKFRKGEVADPLPRAGFHHGPD